VEPPLVQRNVVPAGHSSKPRARGWPPAEDLPDSGRTARAIVSAEEVPLRRLLLVVLAVSVLGALVAGVGLYLALGGGAAPGGALPGGRIVLVHRLDGELPDHDGQIPFPLPGSEPEATLASLWAGLSHARLDDRVQGLRLHIREPELGLAKAGELRRQLRALAGSGKFVDCYLETAGEGSNGTLEIYLASGCQSVWLAPAGEVALLGLYADSLFLRGTLDKLKIEPSFLAAGKFKSAAEAFTERAHSPAAREALEGVLDGFFATVVEGIAEGRGLEAARVRALVDGGPLGAPAALEAKLVDRLGYPDEFEAALEERSGDLERVELAAYGRRQLRARSGGRRIALVFAQGTIVRGGGGVEPWGGERFLGSDDLSETLEQLAGDDGVAAVVLRIDSPGGSALASDLILRRVELLGEKKPVVVSMSDLAASGGYYIAAKARRILAEPGTLTGSIGVVSGKLATGRFQAEHLGATHDPLSRGAHADLYTSLEPFDPEQRALLERRIAAVYELFLDHVAAGRGLGREAVEAVAEGRIWTGAQAQARGLVDELGGLDEAVTAARQAAGLGAGEGRLDLYPRAPGFWEWLRASRAPRLSPELAALLRWASAGRRPYELELSPELAGLARPF
jgi:protease-4